MQWHSIELDAVVRELQADPARGLAPAEATRRLERYGPNELAKEERASAIALFFAQFRNTLIAILLAATVLSAVLGETVDAIIILVIVLFCAVLGFVQEFRAERALDALKKMLAPTVRVLRAGAEMRIASRELVPGDMMLLEAGDRIPADARLAELHSLQCDEAALTGESFAVEKSLKRQAADAAVADRRNLVYGGTTVTYGRAKALVVATGMQTEFGRIAEQVSAVKAQSSPLEKRTQEIGRWLGVIALGVCAAAVLVSLVRAWIGGEVNWQLALTMTMFAIALAVAAVPEALAAIVTGALAIGMHEMAKRNALVRRMPAVETLGCTTVICSDKTGTLTKGEMTARRLFSGGAMRQVGGSGYSPEGQLQPALADDDEATKLLLSACVLCNDAALANENGRWFVKGDPTEGALVVLAAKAGLAQHSVRRDAPRLAELPFSSERKRMTTVHRMPGGRHFAFVKGAPEVVLGRCRSLDRPARERILAANEAMAKDALRVLAFACRQVEPGTPAEEASLEQDLTFLGLVGLMDPPREEAKQAVQVCRKVSIRPVMITGDHRLTAVAVATEIGIYRPCDQVLTGEELARMSDGELARIVERVSVYARVSPMDKLKIVRAWKSRGEVVAMTGDGVNDAPALKHADIGIAMGLSGTDVAKEAADMVLGDDNFATIVRAIERGRWIYDNIQKYLTYLLRANLTEVVVLGGVVIVVGPEMLPLLPAAILYLNLATDGLPALALGIAPPDRNIMQRPPRDPRASVFSRDVRTLVLLGVLIECPIFLWVYFSSYGDLEDARTKILLLFVVVELAISMGFRSLRYSLFEAPPHKWLLAAIVWELALFAALIQFPFVRETFGVRMPAWSDLALVLGVGVVVLAAIELAKAYLRITAAQAAAPIQLGGHAMQKILVPVDGSPNSQFAVRHLARQFINDSALELHLLNVQAPFSSYVSRFLSRRTLRDYHREQAESALRPAREILDGFSIPYAVHLETGDRAECIAAAARRLRCDLIVMSTARKNSLTRLVQNSTTNRVLELTTVPLEVIAGDAVSRWERYGIPAGVGALIALLVASMAD